VMDEFALSASDNLVAPSLPMLLPVLSENEMKQQVTLLPLRSSDSRDECNLSASKNTVPCLPKLLSTIYQNEMKQ
jgi:hypothetical protein